MEWLANDYEILYRSPDPDNVYVFSPSICVLPSGRYVASIDLGGSGAKNLDEAKDIKIVGKDFYFGKIFTSDDKGKTWTHRANRNFEHARLFEANGIVYVIGHSHDIVIYSSTDDGETWDEGSVILSNVNYNGNSCSVLYDNGYVNLVMDEVYSVDGEFNEGWPVFNISPTVLRAKITDDLTKPESWIFSERLRFRDIIDETLDLEYFGVPFYNTLLEKNRFPEKFDTDKSIFFDNPNGWLEGNMVKIKDKNHYWYGENVYHIFMRAHTSGSGYCMLMRAEITNENGKEKIRLSPQLNPSGKKAMYVPMPGGQMRFHVLWDEKTELYWLLSTQAVDTMTRIEKLPEGRYNIPCDERNRLQLSFSKNMVDWCFAGMVAHGDTEKESRHYVCAAIDGEDIVILSRSGDKSANDAHNTNLATLHRVKNFRSLVY